MAFLRKRPCCHPRPVQGGPSSGDDRLHLQQVRGEEDEERQDVVWVAADVGDQQDWSLDRAGYSALVYGETCQPTVHSR